MRGRLERGAHSSPSKCIQTREAGCSLGMQSSTEYVLRIQTTVDSQESGNRESGQAGLPGGCLSLRTSRVVKPCDFGVMSFNPKTPPDSSRERYLRCSLTVASQCTCPEAALYAEMGVASGSMFNRRGGPAIMGRV